MGELSEDDATSDLSQQPSIFSITSSIMTSLTGSPNAFEELVDLLTDDQELGSLISFAVSRIERERFRRKLQWLLLELGNGLVEEATSPSQRIAGKFVKSKAKQVSQEIVERNFITSMVNSEVEDHPREVELDNNQEAEEEICEIEQLSALSAFIRSSRAMIQLCINLKEWLRVTGKSGVLQSPSEVSAHDNSSGGPSHGYKSDEDSKRLVVQWRTPRLSYADSGDGIFFKPPFCCLLSPINESISLAYCAPPTSVHDNQSQRHTIMDDKKDFEDKNIDEWVKNVPLGISKTPSHGSLRHKTHKEYHEMSHEETKDKEAVETPKQLAPQVSRHFFRGLPVTGCCWIMRHLPLLSREPVPDGKVRIRWKCVGLPGRNFGIMPDG